jgi:hypothetical protein
MLGHSIVSLFVASYDSQGYGGGILTRLHTGGVQESALLFCFCASRFLFLGSTPLLCYSQCILVCPFNSPVLCVVAVFDSECTKTE